MPQLWKVLAFDGYKVHVCPQWLVTALGNDLRKRNDVKQRGELTIGGVDADKAEEKFVATTSIDEPGIVCVDRPWMSFPIDGLVVEIPCEDVMMFRLQLENLKPRYFQRYEAHEKVDGIEAKGTDEEGLTYYKLHGWLSCIVLSPYDRYDLLEALKAKEAEAEAQSAAFYANRKLPSQVLREANAAANGIPVEEVPDCGGHKQDRFGKKGEA